MHVARHSLTRQIRSETIIQSAVARKLILLEFQLAKSCNEVNQTGLNRKKKIRNCRLKCPTQRILTQIGTGNCTFKFFVSPKWSENSAASLVHRYPPDNPLVVTKVFFFKTTPEVYNQMQLILFSGSEHQIEFLI